MLITALSLVIALGMVFFPDLYPINLNFTGLSILITLIGVAILFSYTLINSILFIPIQRLEQKLIPGLMGIFHYNKKWRISRLIVFLFSFVTFILALVFASVDIPEKHFYMAVWILGLGISIDLIRDSLKQATEVLNPLNAVEQIKDDAIQAIKNSDDKLLWSSIDALSEIALRSAETSKIALCTTTLNTFPPILRAFFDASKSISHRSQDAEIEKNTGVDEASYTIFYMLQRLELVNSKALQNNLTSICNQIITVLGKIILHCAQLDLSLVTFPTHVLGKFALKALQLRFDDVAAIATSTLLATTKTIVNEVDLTYMELVEPFNTITDNLDAIAQSTFKKDKTINIKLISQSLKDLKEVYQSERLANHRDTSVIIQHVDNKLAEFDALEQIMHTIPSIPNL
ncbi:MAG: hypothetical protein H0W88_00305 [Parachlamydiaceae bacterium]|nr:hypothetical protein [Parachlamydiaceae bacterium]